MVDDDRVKARSLRAINQVPLAQRFDVLAEGLKLLAANVATLEEDATTLGNAGRYQGAAVLRGLADEEAAKVLIIMDLARAGWKDHATLQKCLSSFYLHMARGLYVRAYNGAPADLEEVRKYLNEFRKEYFLDGPTGVDWIFGNEVNSDREERLYVDYIVDEGVGRWVGPAQRAAMIDEPFKAPTPTNTIVELVASMRSVGLLTGEGLMATRAAWDGIAIADHTHWSEVRALNVAVLEKLAPNGFPNNPEVLRAIGMVLDHWCFPLTSLDLTLDEVDLRTLEQERQLTQTTDLDR